MEKRGASVNECFLNLLKVLIGSGVLALPFAVVNVGLVFAPMGLLLVACWNGWNVQRLVRVRTLAEKAFSCTVLSHVTELRRTVQAYPPGGRTLNEHADEVIIHMDCSVDPANSTRY